MLTLLIFQMLFILVVSERSCNHRDGGFLLNANGPIVSTKCSVHKIGVYLFEHTSVSNPNSRLCPSTHTHTDSEALLYRACNHTNTWTPGLKVIDNLDKIPKGEPIGQFINGKALEVWAIFWNCHITGSVVSYEIVKQACGSRPTLSEAGADESLYYTINW